MPVIPEQQLVSDEVQEIINYKPGWIIRRGNVVFCFVLLFLLCLSYVIKYPDVVKASVRIAALSGPKMLAAKTDGRLEKLFISNGQQVKKGQLLAYLQSTAQYNQVVQLKQWIAKAEPFIEANKIDFLVAHPLPLLNELGELQTVYQDFQNNMQETMQVLSNGYYPQKKQSLVKDIQYLQQLQQNLEKQANIQQQDYTLQQIEYNANEKLVNEKVIASLEFNRNKSKLLGKQQGLEQISSQLINGEVARHNKNKELLDLKKFIVDQVQKFRSDLLNLKSKTTEWTEKYIITAPEDGKLEFTSFIQENQLLSNGQELFFIQPLGSSYYAEMRAGQNNLGKITKGQKVLLRLESYPSEEFGYINGVITYIANMPNARDSFLVRVELPEGLRTNYNKDIFFRNNLSASAEIIADDRRLIERFFTQIKNIIKR